MTFGTLFYKNFKNNFRKYGMYLFSIVFSVFTVFTFLSLGAARELQEQFKDLSQFFTVFNVFAIIILIFLFFYLKYINAHFMKQRKKEIATYSLFGMTNRTIGGMLFLENLLIALIGIAIGIVVGVAFFRIVTLLFVNIMNGFGEGMVVKFFFSKKAMLATLIIFVIYFIIIGLLNLVTVHRAKLIDLFNASKKSEKRVKGSWILLLVSLLCLGAGYTMAMSDQVASIFNNFAIILILCILGTYFFFVSGVQIVINQLRKRQSFSYRGDNLLVLSSFKHKMRGNAMMISSIAVVAAIAITALSAMYSMYYSAHALTYNEVPYDILYVENEQTDGYEAQINSFITKAGEQLEENEVYTFQKLGNFGISNYETEYRNQKVIRNDIVQNYDRTGTHYGMGDMYLMKVSDYNRYIHNMKHASTESLSLKPNQAELVISYAVGKKELDQYKKNNILPTGTDQTFEIQGVSTVINLPIPGFDYLGYILVVPDTQYQQLKEAHVTTDTLTLRGINYSHATSNGKVVTDMEQAGFAFDKVPVMIQSSYKNYMLVMRLFGLLFFVGVFVGLVFLITTATLIYFKVMADVEEDQEYYRLLRNIGITEQKQKKIIMKQIVPIFLLPLLMAMVHASFAMHATSIVFGAYQLQVVIPSVIMFSLYTIIYSIFAAITVRSYYQKIK